VPLSFKPEDVAGMRSDGLQGRYSVHDGFARLLAGTGLQANQTSAGYRLVRTSVVGSAAATTLEPSVRWRAARHQPHSPRYHSRFR
jgi:hypothetical protein